MSTDNEEERMRLGSESSTDETFGTIDTLQIEDLQLFANLSARYISDIDSTF